MSRFDCPSFSLALPTLLRRGYQILWGCLGLAIGGHLLLTQISASQAELRTAKPLTARFVKRAPRLTKPLEMKKRPRPKQRQIRRQMVAVQAQLDRREAPSSIRPMELVQGLSAPHVRWEKTTYFGFAYNEAETLSDLIQGSKDPQGKVDMSLEMMDVSALDTGRYHAMVIQDASDKRKIRGFFHLAYVYSVRMPNRQWHYMETRARRGLMGLIEAMNEYTGIRADMGATFTFDSSELLKTPWVFVQGLYSFELTETEAANFGRYLISGGFLFGDAVSLNYETIIGITSIKKMINDGLATQNLRPDIDWSFARIPNDHALYHCYFDFDGVPPVRMGGQGIRYSYLEGAFIGERLLGIVSGNWYVQRWGDPYYPEFKNQRSLQLGINTIIFALTQEGSITKRVMDAVE